MSPSMKAQAPSFSASQFRAALGMFATGVTIVTARDANGAPIGLTANSFNSVSLDPPLVLWSLSRLAGSMPHFSRGSHYAINILAAEQRELAERFSMRVADRFAGVLFREGSGGAPILDYPGRRGCGVRVLQPQPLRRGRPRHLRGRGGALRAA
jgi:flavin reductase (DIM6/NTAB) family NADH-FMN oxidoreductase RutF